MNTALLVASKPMPKGQEASEKNADLVPGISGGASNDAGFANALLQLEAMTDTVAGPTFVEVQSEAILHPEALWEQTFSPLRFLPANPIAEFETQPDLRSKMDALEAELADVLTVQPPQAKLFLPDDVPADGKDLEIMASLNTLQKQSSAMQANATPLPSVTVIEERTHFAPVMPEKTWLQNVSGFWPLALTAETAAPKRSSASNKAEPSSTEVVLSRSDISQTAVEDISVDSEAIMPRPEKNSERQQPAQLARASIAADGVQKEARLDSFLPSVYPSPSVQVSSAIIDELPATRTTPFLAADDIQAASKPALKTLRIALQPAGLGAVTVTLSLRDQALSIEVEAEQEIAASALRQDSQALTEKLSTAGYTVETLTILAIKSEPSGPASLGGDSPAQTLNDRNESGGRETGQKQQSGRDDRAQIPGLTDSNERETEKADPRGGVYL